MTESFFSMPGVVVVGQHDLDTSNLVALARDISNRLNCNIQYGKTGNKTETWWDSIIPHPNKDLICFLYGETTLENNQINVVLEYGEAAFLIGRDIITLDFPSTEVYHTIADTHHSNKNGLYESSYYAMFLSDMNKLGAEEVYFLEEDGTFSIYDYSKYTWNEYQIEIHNKAKYFIEPKANVIS